MKIGDLFFSRRPISMNAMKSSPLDCRIPALVLLMLLATWGCGERDALVGAYQATLAGDSGDVAATLELTADGKGFWSIDTDNAPFRWDIHDDKIRLHTESGGVVEGVLKQDVIEVELPGVGVIPFERVP